MVFKFSNAYINVCRMLILFSFYFVLNNWSKNRSINFFYPYQLSSSPKYYAEQTTKINY